MLAVSTCIVIALLVVIFAWPQVQQTAKSSNWISDALGIPVDSDEDGLNDSVEASGWSVKDGSIFITNPHNSDTDGDGLTDSEEAGPRIETDGPGEAYAGFSNPELVDTDDDGLTDSEEADDGSNPQLFDSDSDDLSDYQEVRIVGSNPVQADTDDDGVNDGYEEENREAQGLDPLFEDTETSALDYASDFARGALAGEASPGDSVAWLAGNLVTSGSSLIPGIGWVVGGIADARDAVASAIRADWVGAGFSLAGMVPYAGDASTIPRKVSAFVVRHPELSPAAGALVVGLDKVPDLIKVDASKQLWTEWDTLRNAGANNEALLRLQDSGRISLDRLGATMKRQGHVTGSPSQFLADGRAGENSLEKLLSENGTTVETQVRASTVNCFQECNLTARIFDAVADGVAHESKVGYKMLDSEMRAQINSDAYLIDTGVIKQAHWHFYPSAHTSQVGASEPFFDMLEEKGIKYTIHAPTTN